MTEQELEQRLEHFRKLVMGHLDQQVIIRQRLEARVKALESEVADLKARG